MNKLSKLTALLLALVLALSMPLQVLAETLDTLPKYEAEVSRLLELLYNNMMAGEDYQELLDMTETMGRQDIVNFLNRMIEENLDLDIAEYDAHIAELFEEYMKSRVIPVSHAYTNVGPFLNYVKYTDVQAASAFSMMSRAATASDSTDGLNTTKSVDWDQATSTGMITIEAYATGTKTTTQTYKYPPLDIILALDQSSSMDETMAGEGYYAVELSDIKTNETYYILDETGENWLKVNYCARNSGKPRCGWTTGCEHLGYTEEVVGIQVTPEQNAFYKYGASTISRRQALLNAVQTFVDQVNTKASGPDGDVNQTADNVEHRIAFIGFDENVRVYNTLGGVTTDNKQAFISLDTAAGQDRARSIAYSKETGLNYLGYVEGSGTRTDSALAKALDILQQNPVDNSQADAGEERTRVVILFTDGEPYKDGNRDTAAADALPNSYKIKNDERATIYSIGVLNGADPGAGIPTSGNFNINKFLHFVSSNYPDADSMSDNFSPNNAGYYLAATNASELNSIFTQIAENIQTGGSTTTLTEETVVKDVLTDTFQLPEGASSVRVYTADVVDATGTTPTFKDKELVYSEKDNVYVDGDDEDTEPDIYPVISSDGKSISVTGFNFSEKWVGTITDEKGNVTTRTEGKKLIIEIDIEPVDGFLGGNDVETNVTDKSGIFEDQDAAEKNEPVMPMPDPPNVNVNMWKIQVVGKHQHIFLSNEADVNALLQSFSLVYQKLNDDGTVDTSVPPYEVNGIRNEYATLKFTLEDTASGSAMVYTIQPGDKAGTWTYVNTETGDPIENFDVTPFLTDDAKYTISYNVIPIEKEDGSDGVAETTGSLDVEVHVYKPTFTFQDTTEDYLSSETAEGYYNTNNFYSESWSHTYYDEITVTINVAKDGTLSYKVVNKDGSLNNEDTSWDMAGGEPIEFTGYGSAADQTYAVTMTGTKPTVEFTYAPLEETWIQDSKVTAVECVPVDVIKVTLTSTNVHNKVTTGENGAEVVGTYTTTSVYTEGSDSAGVTITVDATGAKTEKAVTDIPHIKTLRNELECTCSYNAPEGNVTDIHANAQETNVVPEFVIHIKNAYSEMKIIKNGLKVGESAIFEVKGMVPNGTATGEEQTWTVVLTKTDASVEPSVTITGLLVNSEATITEVGDWSWRYKTTTYDPAAKTVTIRPKTENTATITVTNSYRTDQWLSDEVAVQNKFSTDGQGTVID